MNIEKSIKILDKITTEHKLFNIKHSDGLEEAIETLLTAYEKEKGENVKLRLQDIPLIEGELKAYKDRVNELKEEIEKEKEKNKELIDKIKKMLKELEDRENKQPVIGYWSKKAMLEKIIKGVKG